MFMLISVSLVDCGALLAPRPTGSCITFTRPGAAPAPSEPVAPALQEADASRSPCPSVAAKPLKRPFYRWISNNEMAAGVIPEMREAWPSVSGRCLSSFWRASKLRADTCM